MKHLFSVGLLTLGMLLVMPRAMQAQEPTAPAEPPAAPAAPAPTVEPAVPSPEAVALIVQESISKAQAEVAAAAPLATTAMQYVFGSSSRLSDTKVNLDLDNVGVRDALQRVLDQAKQKYILEEDVPNEPKVRLEAKDIRLSTALDMLTQAAGVSWRHEFRSIKADKDNKDSKGDKDVKKNDEVAVTFQGAGGQRLFSSLAGQTQFESVVRIGKKVPSSGLMVTGDGMNVIRTPEIANSRVLLPFLASEQRSTFTCPHCKGQATVIRRNVQPKCPTCQRAFHPDWKFCPYDNTPRPAAQTTWKFCPICGKDVSPEEAEKNTRTSLFHPEHHQHGAVGVPVGARYRGAVASRVNPAPARSKVRAKNAVRARSTRPAPAR